MLSFISHDDGFVKNLFDHFSRLYEVKNFSRLLA